MNEKTNNNNMEQSSVCSSVKKQVGKETVLVKTDETSQTKFIRDENKDKSILIVNDSIKFNDLKNQIQFVSSKTSDYESSESPTNSDCNSDSDKLQHRVLKIV